MLYSGIDLLDQQILLEAQLASGYRRTQSYVQLAFSVVFLDSKLSCTGHFVPGIIDDAGVDARSKSVDLDVVLDEVADRGGTFLLYPTH